MEYNWAKFWKNSVWCISVVYCTKYVIALFLIHKIYSVKQSTESYSKPAPWHAENLKKQKVVGNVGLHGPCRWTWIDTVSGNIKPLSEMNNISKVLKNPEINCMWNQWGKYDKNAFVFHWLHKTIHSILKPKRNFSAPDVNQHLMFYHTEKQSFGKHFSFPHNVFYPYQNKFQFLANIYFLVCKCLQLGLVQNFVIGEELTSHTPWTS